MAPEPDFGELQRGIRALMDRYYPAWKSACLRADVGEAEPLALPIPRNAITASPPSVTVAGDVPVFIPTPFQQSLLDALEGRSLRTDALAVAAGIDRRNLFRKPGGIAELLEHGLILKHTRLGYYRPDDPPEEILEESS